MGVLVDWGGGGGQVDRCGKLQNEIIIFVVVRNGGVYGRISGVPAATA